ncbi:MAG: hypothetical protein K2X43_23410 [Hyphomonadaceae bacterium]|jgi:hypothetical protein|nr:hypothetical protein [Hyphomonadaceae bacterium]
MATVALNTAGQAMARRHAGKASSRTAHLRDRGRHSKAKTATSENSLKERLLALERERDQLCAALERAQERARKLEEVHAAARDRISWALDSLQNILETKR